MSTIQMAHDTIRLADVINASVDTVWAAFADTKIRAQWSVPAGQIMVYQWDDFRSGGRAAFRCGPAENLEFESDIEYLLIEPRNLVVYSESVRVGDQLLSTGLLTWHLGAAQSGTNITITNQLTSYVGQDMIDGNRNGHRIALEQLAALVHEDATS